MYKSITRVGIDLAKNVFQLCLADDNGKVIATKKVSRHKLLSEIKKLTICDIAMEACASSSYWAREFQALGHRVRLISAQHVKPFVIAGKNDVNDAQGIVEAALRPHIPSANINTIEEQDLQSMLRIRELHIKQRTSIGNQLRGLLLEYGIAIPHGFSSLHKALVDIFSKKCSEKYKDYPLTTFFKKNLCRQYEHLKQIEDEITFVNKEMALYAKGSKEAKLLGV